MFGASPTGRPRVHASAHNDQIWPPHLDSNRTDIRAERRECAPFSWIRAPLPSDGSLAEATVRLVSAKALRRGRFV
jgi:hypothetical protein